MGLLTRLLKILLKIVLAISVGFIIVILLPGLPPHMKFEEFKFTPSIALQPNSILDKAEPLNLKTNLKIIGPESIAITKDGFYTGVAFGLIVKIKDNGEVESVIKTGTAGHRCHGHWDEKCGRPLGMRLDAQGKHLFVADGQLGLLKVDLSSGSVEILAAVNDKMINGKKIKFPDDLDIDQKGNIYFSDATTNWDMQSSLSELLGEPSGRLLKYDATKKKVVELLGGIQFANGIQLSKDETFVMISEFGKARVLRYFLKGPRKGKREVFVDGLPGLPDNIRPNGRGGYYISLYMSRAPYSDEINIIEEFADRPLIRKLLLRLQHMALAVVDFMESFTGPDVLFEQVRYTISYLGMDPETMQYPKKTIIVEIDEYGNVIGNLQNKHKDIYAISEVAVGPEFTYFGSAVSPKIWRIKTSELPKA